MRTPATGPIIKTIGALAMLVGTAIGVLVLTRAVPRALPEDGWPLTLAFAVPVLALAVYIGYLGYSRLLRASRRAFERIWFVVAIFVVVGIGRRVSSLTGYSLAACVGVLSAVIQPF